MVLQPRACGLSRQPPETLDPGTACGAGRCLTAAGGSLRGRSSPFRLLLRALVLFYFSPLLLCPLRPRAVAKPAGLHPSKIAVWPWSLAPAVTVVVPGRCSHSLGRSTANLEQTVAKPQWGACDWAAARFLRDRFDTSRPAPSVRS